MTGYGEFLASLHRDEDGTERVVIDRADPVIRVGADLLDLVLEGGGRGCFVEGDLLKIVAANQTVIYRIGERSPDGLWYRAEWPG